MRFYLSKMALLVAVGGCSAIFGDDEKKYSIYFLPYSAALDDEAQVTARDAASFAQSNPQVKVSIAGFAAPADPKRDIDGLSEQRAIAVKQALITDGVPPDRIVTEANGVTDPKMLPSLAVRRVDISFAR
jgi:outer membrane protein OmpA-like peptidoglycan-associated protein